MERTQPKRPTWSSSSTSPARARSSCGTSTSPLGGHHGLGLNDLAVLLELKSAPSQTLRRVELARRLAVTTSGIARQLAPLERIGLVTRESNPSDARLALVVLTPRGAELAEEASVTANEAAGVALGRLWSAEERAALAPLLRRAAAD